jgi:membrane protease YdiL (CAAX protease family)
MWLVSPLAQDLIFMGWLYGRLDRAFPAYVHEALRIRRAVPLGGAFFAAWHLQNLAGGMSSGFVAFQLAYTATGYVVTGLSRQWTGSMLYATASHSAVNFIAWWAS